MDAILTIPFIPDLLIKITVGRREEIRIPFATQSNEILTKFLALEPIFGFNYFASDRLKSHSQVSEKLLTPVSSKTK